MKNLIFKSIIMASLSTLVFTACASKEEKAMKAQEQMLKKEKVMFACKQDNVIAPKWTCNPNYKDSIAAVGIAKMNAGNDKSMQRTSAIADGKTAITFQISTNVSNLFKTFKGTTGNGQAATFDASSSLTSKQLAQESLQGAKSVDSWTNPVTKELYLLVVVSKDALKNSMENKIKTSFKNDPAMYQKFLASKADGELDKELEKNNN